MVCPKAKKKKECFKILCLFDTEFRKQVFFILNGHYIAIFCCFKKQKQTENFGNSVIALAPVLYTSIDVSVQPGERHSGGE